MGFFSYVTQDTGRSISNRYSVRGTFKVIMTDDKGNQYVENDYDGYGVFGGKDFYALLDEMNGGGGDRSRGIALAFGNQSFISPSLTECGEYQGGAEPEKCSEQGYFYDEDEDEDEDY